MIFHDIFIFLVSHVKIYQILTHFGETPNLGPFQKKWTSDPALPTQFHVDNFIFLVFHEKVYQIPTNFGEKSECSTFYGKFVLFPLPDVL